jgi:serine/threonine protein kinase
VHQHPQENLVIHFAAWTQSERFYILLPLASQNLRAFMNSEPGPELSSEFVLWFLTQLRGLASALQHLHLSYTQIEVVDHPTSPATTSIMAGYHHDLKPENILVFRDHKEDRGKFKISDFGSARLGQLHSGVFGGSEGSATRPSAFGGGTLTYEAPDIVLNHKASRPADMWSLGCIFLELLLWASSAGKSDINDKFAFERLQGLVEYPYVSTDSFWYRGEDGVGRLNSAVIKAMDGVKKAYRGRRAFDGLVSCIEDLLIIEPRERLTAIGLTQRLNVMFAQARADLEEDPNCYLHGNSISSSRIPSIDSRSVEVTNLDLEVSVPAISVRRPSFEVHPGTHGILEDLPDSDFSLEETPHLPPGDTSSGSAQKIFGRTPTIGIPKNHP